MLSVIIPAKNEIYLEQTLRDIQKNARGEYEVITILDGYLPSPPIEMKDDRFIFVHYPSGIGQRQAINEGARRASGKYILKCDAHTAFDEGFDVKLAADCEYDWTVIPRMYNLDIHTWKPKLRRITDFMWIRSPYAGRKPFRHNYWDGKCAEEFPEEYRTFRKAEYTKGDICDVMTGQGACFFMHKDRYWELGGSDEKHGSWGQHGVEIALKAWLSGGSLKVNKKTWFAHWFRGGDGPGFPYNISVKDQERARKYSINFWTEGKWDKQVRSLDWLVNKFAPLPTWNKRAVNRATLTKVISSTNWICKGVNFGVKELHANRIRYADPKKLDGIKWLHNVFPEVVTRILAGEVLTKEKIQETGYYKYLVTRLHPIVNPPSGPTPRGVFHCINKFRELEKLCAAIKNIGLTSPLDMYLDGNYAILTRGARRLEILHQLGVKNVPVRVWRTEWLARHFIPTTAWQNPDSTVQGEAVKQFVKYGHKATDKYWVHNYTPYYDFHMRDKQNKHIKILELGIKEGFSLALWYNAFKKAEVYGIDNKPERIWKRLADKNRIHITTADIYRESFLRKFAKENGLFDLIIDDALHLPDSQRFCLKVLWDYLKEGGLYVIEDLHPNFREKYKEKSIIPILKDKVDSIWMDNKIQSVSFYPNICFIRKA